MKRSNNHLKIKLNNAILFLLALFLFFIAVVFACYSLFTVKEQKNYQKINTSPVSISPHRRILVILLDSARKDFMFSEHMPFISKCRERGAWGISEVVSVPLSIVGDYAIFSGTIPKLSFTEDFLESNITIDNLFERVTEQGKRAVIFGGFLHSAYALYTDVTAFQPKTFLFGQYREETNYIFNQAYYFLKKEKWDVAVVTFYAIDYIGHLETPFSPNYLPTLQLIDSYVQQLVSLTTEQDFVLITSEHGMDDNGFHLDYSPIVLDTPFILWGPLIKKCGPEKILQIDLAPTLSILAGVSPFYNSQALPALNLLKLSDEDNTILLKIFSNAMTGTTTSLSLNELYEKRLTNMVKKSSLSTGIFLAFIVVFSISLLAYVTLSNHYCNRNVLFKITLIGSGMLGFCSMITIALYWNVLNPVSLYLPFGVNFIFSHPYKTTISFVVMITFPMLYRIFFGKKMSTMGGVFLLFIFTLIFTGIFLSDGTYYLLNWAILSIPLVAWGILRRPEWLVVFGALCTGLAIRRLTFYNAYTPINLPDRWILASLIIIVGFVFLYWRLRNDSKRNRTLVTAILCFTPIIVIIAWPCNVEIRAALLLFCLLPILINKGGLNVKEVWLALWVTLYYLGTSSSINHATHVISFPLLLAIWSTARGTSGIARGIMVSLLVWFFYLVPGNSFNLNLLEINDRFILHSATEKQIEFTIMVIASRYIIPAAILIWGITRNDPSISMISIISTALLPAVCGIGIIHTMLISTTTIHPWEQTIRFIVLLLYVIDLFCAFLIVVAISQLVNLFRYFTAKSATA